MQLSTLTTKEAAKALGISKGRLLYWLQHKLVEEPERVVKDGDKVVFRFFTERDMERLRRFQASLHPKGWKSANAQNVRAGGVEGESR